MDFLSDFLEVAGYLDASFNGPIHWWWLHFFYGSSLLRKVLFVAETG